MRGLHLFLNAISIRHMKKQYVITTRFRDIDVSEIVDHGTFNCSKSWPHIRGKEVQLIGPPLERSQWSSNFGSCDGPVYLTVVLPKLPSGLKYRFGKIGVCPHIAEIGD